MGAFADLYGGMPSFNFGTPPTTEATGQTLPALSGAGSLPSWAQTGLSLLGGLGGLAANGVAAYNQLSGKNDRNLAADYEAELASRDRATVSVPTKVPTWVVLLGVVAAGVVVYKFVK